VRAAAGERDDGAVGFGVAASADFEVSEGAALSPAGPGPAP
jgi:hypothetical protein